MRCLFEWDKEYNVELRLALACALHPRLGANSPARVLDAELLQRITELQVWPPTPDVLDNVRRREGERYEQQRIDEEATVLFDCLMAQQDQAPYLRKDTEDTNSDPVLQVVLAQLFRDLPVLAHRSQIELLTRRTSHLAAGCQ